MPKFDVVATINFQDAVQADSREAAAALLTAVLGEDWDRWIQEPERISKLSRGRQAALNYPCAPEFLAALRKRQGIAARALEVTLPTALRMGEVIGARWTEIDLRHEIWTIPPDRLKDRRTRTEPA